MSIPTQGVDTYSCLYPPIAEVEVLGYVRDRNGIGYSRDIGRSSIFGGRCYYVFGDTFCKNERGEFVGISSNTVALMPDRTSPLETEYLDIQDDQENDSRNDQEADHGDDTQVDQQGGEQDDPQDNPKKGIVREFLELNEDEEGLMRDNNSRIVLWAFGGIVETRRGVGWVWYQKTEIDSNSHHHYRGVGIARVSVEDAFGRLSTFRCPGMVFHPNEPRIGTFSSLVDGQYIYLWGDDNQGGIILARVPTNHPNSRSEYRFWNGHTYVPNWTEAIQVLRNVQHGSFFRSVLFGRERKWVFVGCSGWGDSQVLLGAEASLEGPWAPEPLFLATGIDVPNQIRYCMYPHPWALDEGDGDLMVSWSECWPGGVIGARVKLALIKPSTHWKRVFLGGNTRAAREILAPYIADPTRLNPMADPAQINPLRSATMRLEGGSMFSGGLPLCLRIEADNKKTVEDAASSIGPLLMLEGNPETGLLRREKGRGNSLKHALGQMWHRKDDRSRT